MVKETLTLITCSLLFFATSHQLQGGMVTLIANADTFVHAGSLDSNYGDLSLIRIGTEYDVSIGSDHDQLGTKQALFSFDLSSFQSGTIIEHVTFSATQTDTFVETEFEVFITTSDWNENAVTWNNRPTIGASLGLMTVNSNATDGGISMFESELLTNLVQEWVAGNQVNYGISLWAVVAPGSTTPAGDTLASRESSAALLPQLTISYRDPLPPTSTVPEPASIALFGLGSLGMGLIARRRKQPISQLTA